jgi:hypothetical protein
VVTLRVFIIPLSGQPELWEGGRGDRSREAKGVGGSAEEAREGLQQAA